MASSKLTALLALAAASPSCDAFAFTPTPLVQQRQAAASITKLSASQQDSDVDVALRKVAGGAAALLTGMGLMAQVAMADPSAISPVNQGRFNLHICSMSLIRTPNAIKTYSHYFMHNFWNFLIKTSQSLRPSHQQFFYRPALPHLGEEDHSKHLISLCPVMIRQLVVMLN